ncbi:MAG: hypothetical protein KY463_16185 [Actinobacteria bacterium]|nr:hypothetical protein [Actinomycetota bacterium]
MRVRDGLPATVLAAVALAGVGCGDDGGPAARPVDVPQQLAVPPDAEAVELRAETASLFEETVFFVVHATRTGARAGFDSELHKAATDELQHTTEELVETVSPLLDPERVDRFSREYSELLELSRGYGREQLQPEFSNTPFRREIDERIKALKTMLADSSRHLGADDLDEHLALTVDEMLLALDRVGLDSRGQLTHTTAAAHRSRGLAAVVAVAIARESGEIANEAVSEAARLYADLRTLLEEDVHLSFAAVQVGLSEEFDSQFLTASRQVDESATLFADRLATIPEVPGDRRPIRDALRRHWQVLALYAREAAGGDVPELTKPEIEAELKAATELFAALLAERTAIVRETVLDPLEKADKALLEAIEALAHESPEAYTKLAEALDHTAAAADVLTDGVLRVQVEG